MSEQNAASAIKPILPEASPRPSWLDGGAEAVAMAREDEASVEPEQKPILIQAVAVTREDDDEALRLEWLLEGGIAELESAGTVLFALPEANDMCDEDGTAYLYLRPNTETERLRAELKNAVFQDSVEVERLKAENEGLQKRLAQASRVADFLRLFIEGRADCSRIKEINDAIGEQQ